MKDCPVTWTASLYLIRLGSQVHGSLLEELPECYGHMVDDEHCFSSTDRLSVGEDHTGIIGHAGSMRLGFQG